MNYEKRLARLEKYYCTKIINEYKKALAFIQDGELFSSFDEDDGKSMEEWARSALEDITLLTHEERMKYDLEYAHQEVIRKLNEQEVNHKILGKATGQKDPRSIKPASNMKSPPSKKTGNNNEKVKRDSIHEEHTKRQSFLTDEEILKWDPDNFERIRQIEEENDRKWEAEHGAKPMAE